jgi:hypothetical protein
MTADLPLVVPIITPIFIGNRIILSYMYFRIKTISERAYLRKGYMLVRQQSAAAAGGGGWLSSA